MASKHVKRRLIPLAIRKKQIKTMRYQFIPTRTALYSIEQVLVRVWRNWNPVCCWCECKMEQALWKSLAVHKRLKRELPWDLGVPLGVCPQALKASPQTDTSRATFAAAAFATTERDSAPPARVGPAGGGPAPTPCSISPQPGWA